MPDGDARRRRRSGRPSDSGGLQHQPVGEWKEERRSDGKELQGRSLAEDRRPVTEEVEVQRRSDDRVEYLVHPNNRKREDQVQHVPGRHSGTESWGSSIRGVPMQRSVQLEEKWSG